MTTYTNRNLLERMSALGAHLMRLKPNMKQPKEQGWTTAAVLTIDEADAYISRGGNLGVNQALSRLVVLDAENQAATAALLFAGFELTVITAKGQTPTSPKYGGSHVWLRVPDGIDAGSLPADRLGIELPGGGKIDALAGRRYVVAPPSRIDEAPDFMYAPALGGLLDLDTALREVPVAPMWLFDTTVPCPEGLEPLHGILIPTPVHDRVEQSARSAELSNEIDAISWDQWLAGEHRITLTDEVDGCGCPVWHWQGAEHDKSVTLHDGCAVGSGAHIWSGTMIGDLGLTGDHVSRLDLAVALRGESRRAVASTVGISLGEEHEELDSLRPRHYENLAAHFEKLGETARAAMYREAAARMQGQMPTPEQRGETFTSGQVLGALAQGEAPAAPATPAPASDPTPSTGEVPATAETSPPAGTAAVDPAIDPDTGQPWETGTGGVARVVGKLTVRSFPGLALEEIPRPVGKELHEYPMPTIPAHVEPVQDAKTKMMPVLPPLANRRNHENVADEWIFSATPGLSHVAAAADSRAVSRWGMLGALLPRVAAKIPATVRLVPANRSTPDGSGPTGAGTSINVYSVLVGPPASGKTDTMSGASTLIPGVRTLAPGTGEGVLKEFPRADDGDDQDSDSRGGDDGDGVPKINNLVGELPESLMLESDEIDVFVGEMMRQGSKTTGWYRSMWMGGEIGNTASDRDRRSFVAAHTYRFGILLGAQPDAVSQMFGEAGRGTPQRFMWLPAQQSVARGPQYPERLQVPEVYWFNGNPSMIPMMSGPRPPVWISPPPAAIDFMDMERARAATADPYDPAGRNDDEQDDTPLGDAEAIANRHAVLQQLKVSVLLAALDGLTHPQDAHWFAAGAIMAVRKRTIEHLVVTARKVILNDSRKRGQEQGIQLASARAASEREAYMRKNDTTARVAVEASNIAAAGRAITREELFTVLEKGGFGSADYVPDALAALCSTGTLTRTVNDTYVFTPQSPDPGAATVTALRPAPTIGSVGG